MLPAFFWAAGLISGVGAIALVVTDDRSRSRLPPHQFRLVRSLASLRIAPRRVWSAARIRLEHYEAQRLRLEAELGKRPGAREDLIRLLTVMRTDIGHVRNGLERFVRLIGADPASLEEAEACLDRIEEQLLAAERLPEPPPVTGP